MAFSTCSNNSLKRFRNQVTSQQAIHAAMYSASVVLKATDFRFLLEADLRAKQYPDVPLRSTTLPAQSTSVYPRSVTLSAVYLSPWSIVPRDISRVSWHQPSECYDQPCVDSKCALHNIRPDKCSLRTSGPLRVEDTK